MNCFSKNFSLGILGGGQLGKMLLSEANKYAIPAKVLDPSSSAVCAAVCRDFQTSDLMDFEGVYAFGKSVSIITLEIEHVNVDALRRLESEGHRVHPSSQTMQSIQNKILQKQLYQDHNIPTASFFAFSSKKDLEMAVNEGSMGFPFIWKSATQGYDGRGVKAVRSAVDMASIPDGACLAETLVAFEKEIAVIVARSVSGESATYPVVEMEFNPKHNQLEYVIAPARVDAQIAEKAKKLAQEVSKILNAVGVIAVEMFVLPNGEVLVNETAPRPHNSGHYTIEASYTSQFENHLRGILDLPLGRTDNKTPAVMVNLVGEEGYTGDVMYYKLEEIMAIEGVTPHIYGKKQTFPFRKMGHVTVIDTNLENAIQKARFVKNTINVRGTQEL